MSSDHMGLLEHALIDAVVIVEGDEAESTWLLGGLVENDLGLGDGAVLGEVLGEHLLGVILADSADVETLRGDVGLLAVLVVARHRALRIHGLSIDNMRALLHGGVDFGLGGEGDESEATGSLGGWISHDNDVGDLAELRVELAHQLIGGVGREASDENLAKILGLQVRVAGGSSSILKQLRLDIDVRHDSSS